MDDAARDFHQEMKTDVLVVCKDLFGMQDAPARLLGRIVGTLLTDVNRIARALERIADVKEQEWEEPR